MISNRPSYSSSRPLTMKELNSESVSGCPMDTSVSARALTFFVKLHGRGVKLLTIAELAMEGAGMGLRLRREGVLEDCP
jgi:hypothetical protein